MAAKGWRFGRANGFLDGGPDVSGIEERGCLTESRNAVNTRNPVDSSLALNVSLLAQKGIPLHLDKDVWEITFVDEFLLSKKKHHILGSHKH
jgi:hypothetical protein